MAEKEKDMGIRMKKVLWICNIMLPAVAEKLSLPYSNREGWLSGIFDRITEKGGEIEISVCFPMGNLTAGEEELLLGLTVNGAKCYGFHENLSAPEIYDSRLEGEFRAIFAKAQPDMIHIFGTEFPHALAAVRAFGRPERTLIGIQGLCCEIAKIYMAGLPQEVQRKVTLRDFLRRDSLRQQQKKFYLRGENETEAVSLAGHITGRTGFDRKGTSKMNGKAVYHSMNETMRSSFYEGMWSLERCERHSIFLGQGDYPLKGFHFLLQAMPEILKKYPDAKLYVSGGNVIAHQTIKERLKLSAYGKYLLSLIKENHLKDRVVMLGRLPEAEMKKRFLKSNVFVCASVLENSPNTVGEAMLLGVPVAASRAGGIPDMMIDGKEGLLFEAGNPTALAAAVNQIFSQERDAEGNTLAMRISKAGRKRAGSAHDGETNYRRLLEIYGDILGA